MRRNRAETTLASVSIISAAALVLKFRGSLPIPIVPILFGLLAYPIYSILKPEGGKHNLAFLTIGFASLGGVFVFSSPYPVGYADVHKHIFASQMLIENGGVQFLSNTTTGFVGLYVLTEMLSSITSSPIPTIGRIFPLITFVGSVLIFHTQLAKKLLSARASLFATILFATNWGVFRFSVEFRTINLAFPLILLLISLLFNLHHSDRLQRFSLLFCIISITALISHFATFVFFLVIIFTIAFSRLIRSESKKHIVVLVLYSSIVFFLYLEFVNGSFIGALRFTWIQLQNTIISPTPGGSNINGVVGQNYGIVLFLMRWFVRFVFVISFVIFTVVVIRTREKHQVDLWFLSISLGGIFFVASVVGFALNPSRVFIYFAIPFSLTYAVGIFAYLELGFPNTLFENTSVDISSIILVMICVVIISSVLIVPLKFPQYIIGDPNPIRDTQTIDDKLVLNIDKQDISVRKFIESSITSKEEILFKSPYHSGALEIFHIGLVDRGARGGNTNYTVRYSTVYESPGFNNTLYVNGKIEIKMNS